MTENPVNEPGSALFQRIRKLVSERGVDIRQVQDGNALRLEFADGQRILVNLDAHTHNLWLAARSGGTEFIHGNGEWRAQDRSEFFASLQALVEQTIYSNPINARPPVDLPVLNARPVPHPRTHSPQRHGLRNVLILVLAVVLGFWGARKLYAPHTDAEAQEPALALNKLNLRCEAVIPANGSITQFPESGLRSGDPGDPEITLKNDHTHPVLLILSAPDTAIPALTMLVRARQEAVLHLPAGKYDMMFSVGSSWCNARHGFSEGHLLKFDKPLLVQADKPLQLALQTSGPGMENFQLFIKTSDPEQELSPPTFSGDGSMQVQRQANGHFYLPGSVGGVAATFMVDTGASVTSISGELAQQADIRNCKPVQFQTANGEASGCLALVPHMTIGNFKLENITVAVMPNLETNLLGANVLRNFQVSQNDSSMLIGRR